MRRFFKREWEALCWLFWPKRMIRKATVKGLKIRLVRDTKKRPLTELEAEYLAYLLEVSDDV